MRDVILILGGTKEAAELAQKLVTQMPDARIISSLAGRTREPKPIAGEVRIGGFGGADGLAKYIEQNNITKLIDATHPFAKQISQNAKIAAERTGIKLQINARRPWAKHADDIWIEVENLKQARDAIPKGTRVLLALGSQHIAVFSGRPDVHFLVRMVDLPSEPLMLKNYTLEIGKPGDLDHEIALMKKHEITHIICRNSGGLGAYAKIEAARYLHIPVIIVGC